MARIAVLSEDLINQIAAGEVVERPASVVKELGENALDAGAKNLRITLSGGGLKVIRIADDGHGMSRADAQLAMKRHATSKLRDLAGLSTIMTKGFRGEALPAIASVSRFRLVTSEPGAALGTEVRQDGGGELSIDDCAPHPGTEIEVLDLFFNTPARRKFLKREQTELQHAQEAVVRLALAHPGVGFFLEHEGRALLQSPSSPEDPRERIAAALGPEIHPHLLAVEERRLGLSVTGYVASPEYTLSNARGIYTFVNGRYIRDRGLNHALQRAFQDALPPGRQPAAILFVELDPEAVDVNVHPQKLEVRFSDPGGVHDAVGAAVSRSLLSAPWLKTQKSGELKASAEYAAAVERFLKRAEAPPLLITADGQGPLYAPLPLNARPLTHGEWRPGINETAPPGFFKKLRLLGLLGGRAFVCEGEGATLVVLDPHAVIERVRLSSFSRRLRQRGAASSQAALFSAMVRLPPALRQALLGEAEWLAAVGFLVEPFGGDALAVKEVPPELQGADVAAVLEELARVIDLEGTGAALSTLACLAAKDAVRRKSHEPLTALLAALDEADFDPRARHGKVVLTQLSLLELLGTEN